LKLRNGNDNRKNWERKKMRTTQKQANRLEQLDKSQLEEILFKLLKQQKYRNIAVKLIDEEYNFALGEATLKLK